MPDPDCPFCHGLGWVCENHSDRMWSEDGGCQCGAGMPCRCSRVAVDDLPDVEGAIEEIEGEVGKMCHRGEEQSGAGRNERPDGIVEGPVND